MSSRGSAEVPEPGIEITEAMLRDPQDGVYVWIDPDLCTGDGLCTEIDDELFEMDDDGIACVKEGGVRLDHVEGEQNRITKVPPNKPGGSSRDRDHIVLAGEAAEECPGECIFLELRGPGGAPNIPLPLGTIEKVVSDLSI